MANILLDYTFPISVIEGIQQASTAFLKQSAVVVKPKAGQEANVGNLYECVSMSEVLERTDNAESEQLFNAGMTRVLILLANDLNLSSYIVTHKNKFFSLLISNDFSDDDIKEVAGVAASKAVQEITYTAKSAGVGGNDITVQYVAGGTAGSEVVSVVGDVIEVEIEDGVSTATQVKDAIEADNDADALVSLEIASGQESEPQDIMGAAESLTGGVDANPAMNVGAFEGVVGIATNDTSLAQAQAVIPKRASFFKKVGTGSKNLFFAFGKLLSNLAGWNNQQYITMPFSDDVELLGSANSFFDNRVSFVIEDDEFGNRLAFFAAGGKAIVAPYILKNLRIDLQSAALTWINLNQPDYTLKEASLLETRLQEDVINEYVERGWLASGSISITLEQDNFVASGKIEVPTPRALWRVFNEMTES